MFNLTWSVRTWWFSPREKDRRWKHHSGRFSLIKSAQQMAKISALSQVAVDAKSQRSECWNLTLKRSLSTTGNQQNVNDSTAPLSGCRSSPDWHKQSRRARGDTVLNDQSYECSSVWLSYQLLYMLLGENRLEDVIFLLGVSHILDRNFSHLQ